MISGGGSLWAVPEVRQIAKLINLVFLLFDAQACPIPDERQDPVST